MGSTSPLLPRQRSDLPCPVGIGRGAPWRDPGGVGGDPQGPRAPRPPLMAVSGRSFVAPLCLPRFSRPAQNLPWKPSPADVPGNPEAQLGNANTNANSFTAFRDVENCPCATSVPVPPLTLAVGSGTGTGQAAPGAVPVAAGHLGLSAHFPRASAASCGKDGAFRPVPSSDS